MAKRLIIVQTEPLLYKKAAELILETAAKALKERGSFSLVLSGGSTPKKLFSLLTDPYYKSRLPWDKTFVFWGDERFVPPNHADSNYGMTKEALLSKVPLPESHIFRIKGEMETPQQAAKAYESTIRAHFKSEKSIPSFDFNLLGLGTDGHTASLFPNTTALNEKIHMVTANYVEKLKANRVTMTYPLINNSRRILFLCKGADKASILNEVHRTDMPQDRYPSQRINATTGELIWLMDKPASTKLPPDVEKTAEYQ